MMQPKMLSTDHKKRDGLTAEIIDAVADAPAADLEPPRRGHNFLEVLDVLEE